MHSPIHNLAQRVIGGVFALQEPEPPGQANRDRPFLQQGVLHLASARGAFCLLVRVLRPRRVWLPSYLCCSIVEGFRAADAAVEFFPVTEDLHCGSTAWLQGVARGDLVLRIHYFGFPNVDPVFQEAVARGACLVDDAAQALLSEGVGTDADFVVFSPRKFVGLPDGGCLVIRIPLPDFSPQLPPPPDAWWRESLSAVALRRDFDCIGGNRDWFTQFRLAENHVPAEPHAMSELTRRLLAHGINFEAVASHRRDNYRLLLKLLGDVAMFPELPEGVVPLGFPIRARPRDAIRDDLFRQHIFPPVHWPLCGCVPASFDGSHRLAAEIMTLPCDQRYGADDMRRVAAALRDASALSGGASAGTT
jgi:hypothetical protein